MIYAHQQLFHWVGSHIEKPRGRPVSDKREKYVECLREFLREGFRLKIPRSLDTFPGGGEVSLPIACFTDWDLRDSRAHTERYGKLGFGVTKQFVLAAGGHPVTYANVKSPLSRAFAGLQADITRLGASGGTLDANLKFIAHFTKRIRPETKPRGGKNLANAPVRGTKGTAHPDHVFRRSWGIPANTFLEEREWRIVYGPHLADDVDEPKRARIHFRGPLYFLKPKLGHELVSVVFPDNATIHHALKDDAIRRALVPKNQRRPHVALISLTDVETY